MLSVVSCAYLTSRGQPVMLLSQHAASSAANHSSATATLINLAAVFRLAAIFFFLAIKSCFWSNNVLHEESGSEGTTQKEQRRHSAVKTGGEKEEEKDVSLAFLHRPELGFSLVFFRLWPHCHTVCFMFPLLFSISLCSGQQWRRPQLSDGRRKQRKPPAGVYLA